MVSSNPWGWYACVPFFLLTSVKTSTRRFYSTKSRSRVPSQVDSAGRATQSRRVRLHVTQNVRTNHLYQRQFSCNIKRHTVEMRKRAPNSKCFQSRRHNEEAYFQRSWRLPADTCTRLNLHLSKICRHRLYTTQPCSCPLTPLE